VSGAGHTCRVCGHRTAQRSRSRWLGERLWKRFTPKRLFRCDRCGWRGWLQPLDHAPDIPTGDAVSLDLRDIDQE
jgi:hypothetical protein